RVFAHPVGDRADATQHVPRRSAGQHRPHPRFLHRRHRWAVLRPDRRFPQRSAAAPAHARRRGAGCGRDRRHLPNPRWRNPRWLARHRKSERNPVMNNLYRELAPATDVAWAEIELEASRTFKRHIAGRRVVDVSGPSGPTTAAVSTGHLNRVSPPSDGVIADLRDSRPLVRLRVPFTVTREAIDDVERGAQDSDWDPVKEAAQKLAWAEDRAIFEGYAAADIQGIRACSSNPALALPDDPRDFADVLAQALSELRLSGVGGPYSVLLSADAYTKVSET